MLRAGYKDQRDFMVVGRCFISHKYCETNIGHRYDTLVGCDFGAWSRCFTLIASIVCGQLEFELQCVSCTIPIGWKSLLMVLLMLSESRQHEVLLLWGFIYFLLILLMAEVFHGHWKLSSRQALILCTIFVIHDGILVFQLLLMVWGCDVKLKLQEKCDRWSWSLVDRVKNLLAFLLHLWEDVEESWFH